MDQKEDAEVRRDRLRSTFIVPTELSSWKDCLAGVSCAPAGGGVGVFAIKQIKKGTQLFTDDSDEMLWVEKKSVPKKPLAIRRLYEFAVIKNGRYGCPPTFNRLTMAWYLNHSKKPNAKCTAQYDFRALRGISVGTELTVDYSTYNDPEALDFKK